MYPSVYHFHSRLQQKVLLVSHSHYVSFCSHSVPPQEVCPPGTLYFAYPDSYFLQSQLKSPFSMKPWYPSHPKEISHFSELLNNYGITISLFRNVLSSYTLTQQTILPIVWKHFSRSWRNCSKSTGVLIPKRTKDEFFSYNYFKKSFFIRARFPLDA